MQRKKTIKRIEDYHPVLTMRDATDFLGISRPTLMKLIKQGKIPARDTGGKYLFSRDALLQWLANK